MNDIDSRLRSGDLYIASSLSSFRTGVVAQRFQPTAGSSPTVRVETYRITPQLGFERLGERLVLRREFENDGLGASSIVLAGSVFEGGGFGDLSSSEAVAACLNRAAVLLLQNAKRPPLLYDLPGNEGFAVINGLTSIGSKTRVEFVRLSLDGLRHSSELCTNDELFRRFLDGRYAESRYSRPQVAALSPDERFTMLQQDAMAARSARWSIRRLLAMEGGLARMPVVVARGSGDVERKVALALAQGLSRALFCRTHPNGQDVFILNAFPALGNGPSTELLPQIVRYSYVERAGQFYRADKPEALQVTAAAELIGESVVVGIVPAGELMHPQLSPAMSRRIDDSIRSARPLVTTADGVRDGRVRSRASVHHWSHRSYAVQWSNLLRTATQADSLSSAGATADDARSLMRTSILQATPADAEQVLRDALWFAGVEIDEYWNSHAGQSLDFGELFDLRLPELVNRRPERIMAVGREPDVEVWMAQHRIDIELSRNFVVFSRLESGLRPADKRREGTMLDALGRKSVPIALRATFYCSALQNRATDALIHRLLPVIAPITDAEGRLQSWVPHLHAPNLGVEEFLAGDEIRSVGMPEDVATGPRFVRSRGVPSIADAVRTLQDAQVMKVRAAAMVLGQARANYVAALTDVTMQVLRAASHHHGSETAASFAQILDTGGKERLTVGQLAAWDQRAREKCIDFGVRVEPSFAVPLTQASAVGVEQLGPSHHPQRYEKVERLEGPPSTHQL
jgi:hypothetical protein